MTQTTSGLSIRRADERGRTDWGWLDSRHTFSFGDYRDPRHMGFRACASSTTTACSPAPASASTATATWRSSPTCSRAASSTRTASGGGGVIRPGEIQFMRAGTGVTHSEFNQSKTEPVHFLQIWIVPDARGLPPRYAQRAFDREAARTRLRAAGLARRARRQHPGAARTWSSGWRAGRGRRAPRADAGAGARTPGSTSRAGGVSLNGAELGEGDGVALAGPARLALEGRGRGGSPGLRSGMTPRIALGGLGGKARVARGKPPSAAGRALPGPHSI